MGDRTWVKLHMARSDYDSIPSSVEFDLPTENLDDSPLGPGIQQGFEGEVNHGGDSLHKGLIARGVPHIIEWGDGCEYQRGVAWFDGEQGDEIAGELELSNGTPTHLVAVYFDSTGAIMPNALDGVRGYVEGFNRTVLAMRERAMDY